MARGGKRSTTWSSSWNLGKTKLVRVPIAIADDLKKIARQIDEGKLDLDCLLQGKSEASNALLQGKKEELNRLAEEALKLKANAGGKIKQKIKQMQKIWN